MHDVCANARSHSFLCFLPAPYVPLAIWKQPFATFQCPVVPSGGKTRHCSAVACGVRVQKDCANHAASFKGRYVSLPGVVLVTSISLRGKASRSQRTAGSPRSHTLASTDAQLVPDVLSTLTDEGFDLGCALEVSANLAFEVHGTPLSSRNPGAQSRARYEELSMSTITLPLSCEISRPLSVLPCGSAWLGRSARIDTVRSQTRQPRSWEQHTATSVFQHWQRLPEKLPSAP